MEMHSGRKGGSRSPQKRIVHDNNYVDPKKKKNRKLLGLMHQAVSLEFNQFRENFEKNETGKKPSNVTSKANQAKSRFTQKKILKEQMHKVNATKILDKNGSNEKRSRPYKKELSE